jgi:WD40 repeat protein
VAALEINSERHLLTGHDADVVGAEFSPDGTRIVTASHDRTAALWDAATGRRTGLLLGHQGQVTAASFNHDGRLAVTCSYDSTAAIWDVESGRRLHVLHCDKPVMAACFSSEGTLVATAGYDNRLRIWDVATGGLRIGPLSGHSDYIRFIEFSRDGKKLLTGSADMTARVWNAQSGELLAVLAGHSQPIAAAQFSPDGKQVITAAAPRYPTETPTEPAARLWDANNGQLLARLESGDGTSASSAAFSPDGRWIAVGFADGSARLWDMRQALFTRQVTAGSGWIMQVGFSGDSQAFFTVTSKNAALTWKAEDGNRLAAMYDHAGPIVTARFSPDGDSLVTASRDDTARVWRTDQNSLMPHLRHADEVGSVRLAPGNSRIVTLVGPDRIPHLWSLPEGRIIATLPHPAPVAGVTAFNRSGELLLTTSDDGNSYLWSASDGRLRFTLSKSGIASSAVFEEDSRALLIASYASKKASKWDLQTGALRQAIDLSHALMLTPSPNGRYVLALSADQFKLQMWNADSGNKVWELGPSAQFVSTEITRDGRIVGTFELNTNVATLWSTATGEKLAILSGHSGSILSLSRFSADGESVFTVSQDGTCRRWSATTGLELARFEELGTAINRIEIGNGNRIVTQASDHSMTLWNLDTGKPVCPLGTQESQEIRFSRDGRFVLTGACQARAAAAPAD